jgi:hypothetical protein
VTLTSATQAKVKYDLSAMGTTVAKGASGTSVLQGGTWKGQRRRLLRPAERGQERGPDHPGTRDMQFGKLSKRDAASGRVRTHPRSGQLAPALRRLSRSAPSLKGPRRKFVPPVPHRRR